VERAAIQKSHVTVQAIISNDIEDNDACQTYVPGVIPLLEKHGAEIALAGYDALGVQGDRHGVYVAVRFPSEVAARAWHSGPADEEVRRFRLALCRNNGIVTASESEAGSG
jgi:uncharacterized protein (DUF1330 family)